LDLDEAPDKRMAVKENRGCDSKLMAALDSLIRCDNKNANGFKMMREIEIEEREAAEEGRTINLISMLIRTERSNDQRRYNSPRVNEVAIVFQNTDGEPLFELDLRIYSRSEKNTQLLLILDANWDPMVYPILFPLSELGWDEKMISLRNSSRNRITMLQFYSNRLTIRREFNSILNAAKLDMTKISLIFILTNGLHSRQV
jgi:hypothetical protein